MMRGYEIAMSVPRAVQNTVIAIIVLAIARITACVTIEKHPHRRCRCWECCRRCRCWERCFGGDWAGCRGGGVCALEPFAPS